MRQKKRNKFSKQYWKEKFYMKTKTKKKYGYGWICLLLNNYSDAGVCRVKEYRTFLKEWKKMAAFTKRVLRRRIVLMSENGFENNKESHPFEEKNS